MNYGPLPGQESDKPRFRNIKTDRNMNNIYKSIVLFFCLGPLLFTASCRPPAEPSGSVSGTVTYQGKPLEAGYIIFMSHDKANTASAKFDGSGNFSLSQDLPVGEYRIGIAPPLPPLPIEDSAKEPVVYFPVPFKFHSAENSNLAYTVHEGPNTAEFDVR